MSFSQSLLNLADFERLRKINEVAFSKFYKVRNKTSGSYYTAEISKLVIDKEVENDTETLCHYRQINLMSFFNHPSIIRFFGYSPYNFKDKPAPTIITEYAANGILKDILNVERVGLSLDEWDDTRKLIIIYGIASGMAYLHEHEILHRDINPENIYLDENFHPKIGGFYLSKNYGFISSSLDFHFKEGLLGIPIYMAPEIFREGKYSKSSDVYAFAITIYGIITGEVPFKKISYFQLMRAIPRGDRPEIPENVPEAYQELIKRCWSQNPDDRPSFSEIVDELKNNEMFITDSIDQSEFYDYVDYLDSCKPTFDTSNPIQFNDFINPPKNIPIRPIKDSPFDPKTKKEDQQKTDDKQVSNSPNDDESYGIFFDASKFELTEKKAGDEDPGSVYIVKSKQSKIKFAIKIKTEGLNSAKSLQLFVNDAMNWKELSNHPAILHFYGINFHSLKDPKLYEASFLTEFIRPGFNSLRSIFESIKKKKIVYGWNPTKKIIILLGISHAMMSIHRHNQVHSNLKPENVILDSKLYPKVRDIGKSMSGKNEVTFCTAPEVFKDKEVCTKEADVYSFAMIAYEIMAEIEPFSKSGKSLRITHLEKKMADEKRPDFNDNVTKPMRELITMCWNNDPTKRPTFDQIYTQLSSQYKTCTKDKIDEKEVNDYIAKLNEFNEEDSSKSSEKVHTETIEKVHTQTIEKVPSDTSNDDNYFFGEDEEKNYETVGTVGEGMTSIVFKIVDKRTNVPLCKKVLKVEGSDFKDVQNALKEFQVLHTLHHPCLCYAIGINPSEVVPEMTSDDGGEVTTVALFLEFIDFKLKDFLANNMLNSTLKTRIIVEVAHGLRYLHSKGMIYRDLKVDNVMLNSVFQVKLIDFGLVKINEFLLGEEAMNSMSMTKGIGDFQFMSPEMSKDLDYDNKTDVFSFGVLTYLIFVGKLPKQTMKEKSMGKPIILPEESQFISAACIELMSMCLMEDPKERPSFDEVLKFIRDKKFMLASDVDPSIVSQRDNELELIKDA